MWDYIARKAYWINIGECHRRRKPTCGDMMPSRMFQRRHNVTAVHIVFIRKSIELIMEGKEIGPKKITRAMQININHVALSTVGHGKLSHLRAELALCLIRQTILLCPRQEHFKKTEAWGEYLVNRRKESRGISCIHVSFQYGATHTISQLITHILWHSSFRCLIHWTTCALFFRNVALSGERHTASYVNTCNTPHRALLPYNLFLISRSYWLIITSAKRLYLFLALPKTTPACMHSQHWSRGMYLFAR